MKCRSYAKRHTRARLCETLMERDKLVAQLIAFRRRLERGHATCKVIGQIQQCQHCYLHIEIRDRRAVGLCQRLFYAELKIDSIQPIMISRIYSNTTLSKLN